MSAGFSIISKIRYWFFTDKVTIVMGRISDSKQIELLYLMVLPFAEIISSG
jgi:hypothetical protein